MCCEGGVEARSVQRPPWTELSHWRARPPEQRALLEDVECPHTSNLKHAFAAMPAAAPNQGAPGHPGRVPLRAPRERSCAPKPEPIFANCPGDRRWARPRRFERCVRYRSVAVGALSPSWPWLWFRLRLLFQREPRARSPRPPSCHRAARGSAGFTIRNQPIRSRSTRWPPPACSRPWPWKRSSSTVRQPLVRRPSPRTSRRSSRSSRTPSAW
jgi:hypothetical protein